jgi:hypothetical protein
MFGKKMTLAASILFACGLNSPVFAGSLEEAVKFYQAKNYAKALPLFEKVVKENPTSWQTHYYLGHTLVALRKLPMAKYHYQCCVQLCANPVIASQCQTAIAQIDKAMPPRAVAPAATAPNPKGATAGSAATPPKQAEKSAK